MTIIGVGLDDERQDLPATGGCNLISGKDVGVQFGHNDLRIDQDGLLALLSS